MIKTRLIYCLTTSTEQRSYGASASQGRNVSAARATGLHTDSLAEATSPDSGRAPARGEDLRRTQIHPTGNQIRINTSTSPNVSVLRYSLVFGDFSLSTNLLFFSPNPLSLFVCTSYPPPPSRFDSPYRSTCSIPAALNTSSKAHPPPPDSPRSTRSAPWMRSQQRGLFGINSSPKSVRSASTRMSAPANPNRMRSSSVESHSSNESRSGRRRRHRSRRVSDNESEMSRGSGRSGRSHNSHRKHRRHRSKNRRNRSDTESRDRSYSSHHRSTESIELVDSGEQWLEVQRKQADNVQKAAVIKSSQVLKGSTPDSGIVAHHHRSRRHRKHRSPSEKIWSSELTKHLQFDLVDTTGMSEDQLREIPYTVVETSHHHASKKPSALKVHKTSHNVPPMQRIDRIREFSKENVADNMSGVNGSIRSASTISSSRDYDRNSGLIRYEGFVDDILDILMGTFFAE